MAKINNIDDIPKPDFSNVAGTDEDGEIFVACNKIKLQVVYKMLHR